MTNLLKQSKCDPVSAPSPLSSARPFAPSLRAGTQSGGQALDKHTQASMSARFGHDFSSVRIHTDARAEESADALGAHAFATGSDIVFAEGKYTPGSPETDRLLAHELTHVAQQGRSGTAPGGDSLSRRGDAAEREADSLAPQVMMGQSVQVQAVPTAAVHRFEAPDWDWAKKTIGDTAQTAWDGAEMLPGLGNGLSALSGTANMALGGAQSLAGDKGGAAASFSRGEDNYLNAVPLLGNYRAANQFEHNAHTVMNDFNGVKPNVNRTSENIWTYGGGEDRFNDKASHLFDQFTLGD